VGHWGQAGAERLAGRLVAAPDDFLRRQQAEAEARRDAALRQTIATQCLEALRAMESGDYASSREQLRGLRAPGSLRHVVSAVQELPERLEAVATDPDHAYDRLEVTLGAAWSAAVASELHPLLVGLASVAGTWEVGRLAQQIVETYSSPAGSRLPDSVRRDLEIALKPVAVPVIEAALNRLAITPGADTSGRWLLALVCALGPAKAARKFVQLYFRLERPAQAQLVGWLARLADESEGALFDLLAATLTVPPLDRRPAEALQARIGADRLEQATREWAMTHRHPGARTVWRVLYGYGEGGFGR
jgi:hypothetical protein